MQNPLCLLIPILIQNNPTMLILSQLLEAAGNRPPQLPQPFVEIEIHRKSLREIRGRNGESRK